MLAAGCSREASDEDSDASEAEVNELFQSAARGALEFGAYHSWAQDPFAAGDWAIYAPGQLSRFGDAMALPHDRVHFCGEHTAIGNRGMEGAMESAERVSIEVLGAL